MIKREMVLEILEQVEEVKCYIVRTYGVSRGVGYDLNVGVEFSGVKYLDIQAHAVSSRSSWDMPEHLRPNNPIYKYTGDCDYYKEDVMDYWDNGRGFAGYLQRLQKPELEYILGACK